MSRPTDALVDDAMRRLLAVHESDQCARGWHDYEPWSDGIRRCACGKAHPADLDRALGADGQ